MSVLSSSCVEFHNIRYLVRQLAIWEEDQSIPISTLLRFNSIGCDCSEIGVLLKKCFEAKNGDKDQDLSECLSQLSEIAARCSVECLKKLDRLDDLITWIALLKVLCDSSNSHPAMWTDSVSPKEGQVSLQKELKRHIRGGKISSLAIWFRICSDAIRKKLSETPEFAAFMMPKTESDLYLENAVDIVNRIPNCSESDVEKFIKDLPANFKFQVELFDK